MSSPTTRSKAMLEKDGWTVAIVEKFNSFTKTRHDLFGFADLLAMKPGEVPKLIQVTSTGWQSRVQKIKDEPKAAVCLASGFTIEVHGWRKLKVKRGGKAIRWTPKIILLTEDDFDEPAIAADADLPAHC
jgi:small ligand-binding sensory domain FIST